MDWFGFCLRLFLVQIFLITSNAHAEDWRYTIKPGDSLWTVCAEHVTGNEQQCTDKLQSHNPQITDSLRLPPGMLINIPVAMLKQPPKLVVVEFTQGKAYVERAGAPQREVLKAGATLNMGSTVTTESDSSVLLRFADDTTFLLKANSEIKMDKLSAFEDTGMVDARINLDRGEGKVKVQRQSAEPRFQIQTPSAVAAVRGTEFRISSDPAKNHTMRSSVLTGLIAVAAQAVELEVKAGFGTIAEAGKPPLPPRQLLPAPAATAPGLLSLPYTLNWSQLDDAVSYVLEIFEGNTTDKLLQSLELAANNYTFTGLDDGSYTVSVRGIDDIGLQGLNAIVNFISEKLLPAPRLDPAAIKPNGDRLNISWPAVDGAAGYRVDIGSDAEFSELIYSQVVDDNAIDAPLFVRHNYFVKVQAIDRHGRFSEPAEVIRWSNKVIELWLALALVITVLLLVLRFR